MNRPKAAHAKDPRKLLSGHWQARVTYWDPTTGRRKETSRTFPTEREAKQWGRVQEVQLRETNGHPPSDELLGDYLIRWLSVVRCRVRPVTLSSYRQMAAHAIEGLGGRPLKLVSPLDLQSLYTSLGETLSSRTVNYVHAVLRRALGEAEDWGLMASNPARKVRAPRITSRELQIPTAEETQRFLYTASNDRLHALWAWLAVTGTRRGEALGLKWEDIDWNRQTALIRRTLTGHGPERQLTPPKTPKSQRRIALSDELVAVLQSHRERQELERLSVGGVQGAYTGLVFTTRQGHWLEPRHVLRRFKQLLAKAGLPTAFRIHDLRHGMATAWLAEGIVPNVVSERLGHANVAFTMQVYGHVLPHQQANAAKIMDPLFLGDPHRRE